MSPAVVSTAVRLDERRDQDRAPEHLPLGRERIRSFGGDSPADRQGPVAGAAHRRAVNVSKARPRLYSRAGALVGRAKSQGTRALAAYNEAARRAVTRQTFGRPIIENQGLAFKLADMATQVEASRNLVYQASAMIDEGHPHVTKFAAMAKLFASDTAMRVTTDAVAEIDSPGQIRGDAVSAIFKTSQKTSDAPNGDAGAQGNSEKIARA